MQNKKNAQKSGKNARGSLIKGSVFTRGANTYMVAIQDIL